MPYANKKDKLVNARKYQKTEKARTYQKEYKQRPEQQEKHRIRERNRSMWRRAWIIAIMGSECRLCNDNNPLMLSVDHVLKDGKAHREKVGKDPNRMYTAILREGCPPECYRLLCMSCNLAISHHGEELVKWSIKHYNQERRSTNE